MKNKMNIIVTKEGLTVGYIKSISETNETFKVVENKEDAKDYTNEDKIHSDIDVLTRISSEYIFLYN